MPAGAATATVEVAGVAVPTLPLMALPTAYDATFPIDVVYTWVDGDDPEWNAARQARGGDEARPEAGGQARFRSRDELLHSMRSVHLFAPWVRTIHLVTAGQRPGWLADDASSTDASGSSTTARSCRPTRCRPSTPRPSRPRCTGCPGLAEHFVYLNDDVFLGRATRPELFFSPGGAFAAFVGDGAIGLPGTADKPFLHAAATTGR